MDLTDVMWRKSSRSTNNGGECVELARIGRLVAVRDSKDPQGPVLVFDTYRMRAFLDDVRRH